MDVFLQVCRKKAHIFCDAKESNTVLELKKIIQGILRARPEDQRLFKDGKLIEDHQTLAECGFTNATARAQSPATVGLALRQDDGKFEQLEISALSVPPDLPEVMKGTQEPISQTSDQPTAN